MKAILSLLTVNFPCDKDGIYDKNIKLSDEEFESKTFLRILYRSINKFENVPKMVID